MFRWIFRIFSILLLFVVIAVAGFLVLPADRIAGIAADQIRLATGRDVTITGDVSMSVWPVLGASVESIEVGNATWSEQGPMLTAKNAAVGIDAMALLSGELRITNIEAHAPTIRLESRADGRASWQFTDGGGTAQISTETAPGSTTHALSIERLRVTDATLIYDAEGSDLVSYSGVDLALDWPRSDGPADIKAVLRPVGDPVEVAANISNFGDFLTGSAQSFDVTMTAGSGGVMMSGTANLTGEVAGDLSINTSNTDGFLTALGLPAAGLPRGLGQSMKVQTGLALSSDRFLSLRGFVADLDGNLLQGGGDISLNGTPHIALRFDAGDLDLTALTEGGETETASPNAGTGWSKEPIDASGLASFNGAIGLNARSIDLGVLKLGSTETMLANDRSRMVFGLTQASAYGGILSGEFVVNNRNGLSVGGKFNGSGVEMQGLLNDLAGINWLTGGAETRLSFLGVGQSLHEIMHSLKGDGGMRVGRGTIQGVDLDQLLRSGNGGGGTTLFDSLGADFVMSEGNLYNEDLALVLPSFQTRGQGRIGLGRQDIDYTVTPMAFLGGGDAPDVLVPVRIEGPWSDLNIYPDLEALAAQRLQVEREKLEQAAKLAIEEKVQEHLGVTTAEGQTLEQAVEQKVRESVEQKLEDALGQKLNNLFR